MPLLESVYVRVSAAMVRPKPPAVVPTITFGFDTEVGVTHDTTTSRVGSSPKVRWTCSAVTVSALAACCHRIGPLATTRPPAVTPTPPRNDRRETLARSILSVITVPPEAITGKTERYSQSGKAARQTEGYGVST